MAKLCRSICLLTEVAVVLAWLTAACSSGDDSGNATASGTVVVSSATPTGPVSTDRAELQDQLGQHRSQWHDSDVSSYRYSFELSCFCYFEHDMPFTITVSDGRPQSLVYADGTPVDDDIDRDNYGFFTAHRTIDELFDEVNEWLLTAEIVMVSYDPTYGFPSEIFVDHIVHGSDDEFGLTVTQFEEVE